jgi:hypothetical protein
MAAQLPWDLTQAYVQGLASWHCGLIPWERVRVMAGPIRSFGLSGASAQQPVCIVSCAGWQGGEKVAAIGNRTDVDWLYAVAIVVPDDATNQTEAEKLRQDLVYAFDLYHQTPANRDLIPNSGLRSGHILSCVFENGPFFAEGDDLYRIATYQVVWTARRHT